MRRSACFLALLGLSVQTAVGEDASKAATRPATPSQRSMQFFSAAPVTPVAEVTPQRFSRSTATKEQESDLQNYYKELFGEADMPTAKPAQPAKPSAEAKSRVVQAEYQADPVEKGNEIQQVRAERFNARPFPGAGKAAEPTAATPATPATSPAASRSSLTQPISTKPQPAPETPAGGLSISRGTPATAAKIKRAEPTAQPRITQEEFGTAAPAVSVTWRKESEINVGQECRCHLVVKNSGQTAAQEVQLRAFFPENVRLVKAVPAPAYSQEFLGWQISELKAGEEQVIEISMIPLQRGDIATRADVRFSGTANGLFAVAEPMLGLEIEGPAQVLIGEPAPHTVTVTNPGTGIANNVQIEAHIPEGLEHARGHRLVMELGSLNPGESRSVRLALAAVKGGSQNLQVEARAESGLVRHQATELVVIAPSLNTTIAGPSMRYLGRQGTFALTVSNDGAAASDNVRVMHKIPSGFEFVSSDRGAQYDSATGLLNWFVGRLEKGQKAEIKVTLLAKEAGEQRHLVRATSEHGTTSDADMTTMIEGTSSLALQVKDLEDPVEVGSETVYEVRVKNEGSAAARNVALGCELPAGMSFVSAEGPVEFRAERGSVLFRSIPELGAGQSVTFKVKVSAAAPGSLRFRALLTSESVGEPLAAEEMTKFYGE
ncbi:hypothetical protein [Planctomicrobium sp. SH664]|uniref:hypothetical protein n=1 Tax=Planctomicrobium sp. SH664 TaxID=3448125 RepID=UPI003F5AF3EF